MIGFFGYLLVIAAGNSAFQAELHADDECGEGQMMPDGCFN